jgi:FtsP/CotA-like multicopper oxidase with cupredoxin domain
MSNRFYGVIGFRMTVYRPDRRQVLGGAGALALLPRAARAAVLTGPEIVLRIERGATLVDGHRVRAITINGTVPGPTLRLRQGQVVRITVVNALDVPTSLHWHGLLLPSAMDGVPGVSFPGIAPGASFTYEFPLPRAGTYWYHSHSGYQEMEGCYGALVIDPLQPDPMPDRVVLLSDLARADPARMVRNLKADPGYYNHRTPTLLGGGPPLGQRLAWARMRMDPSDIADLDASALHYLVNGAGPRDRGAVLAEPGRPLRLRFVNAASMTHFNVRIPGLPLTVVAADGQDVRPVETDEFQFGPGETYDAIVTPGADPATIVAETMDRSGMARATLARAPGLAAPVPPLRPAPLLTMKDVGMDMPGMDMKGMSMRDNTHARQVAMGPGVDMITPMAMDRTGDPGIGLDDVGHRVLTYRDLVAAVPDADRRAPERTITLHLTGAMDRYMWSFDGRTMHQAPTPIAMRAGERVRVTLVNDTMMAHPIHLHGHLFALANGQDPAPLKHTVTVQPGGRASFDATAQAGDWAFHCHLALHMAMGMMRVVQVRGA